MATRSPIGHATPPRIIRPPFLLHDARIRISPPRRQARVDRGADDDVTTTAQADDPSSRPSPLRPRFRRAARPHRPARSPAGRRARHVHAQGRRQTLRPHRPGRARGRHRRGRPMALAHTSIQVPSRDDPARRRDARRGGYRRPRPGRSPLARTRWGPDPAHPSRSPRAHTQPAESRVRRQELPRARRRS